MTSPVALARTELAAVTIPGVHLYDHYPGAPEPPAVIIGLPRTIRPETGRLNLVELPVEVMLPGRFDPATEAQLLELTQVVRDAFQGFTSANVRGAGWVETTDFGAVQVGNAEWLGATVLLRTHIPTS